LRSHTPPAKQEVGTRPSSSIIISKWQESKRVKEKTFTLYLSPFTYIQKDSSNVKERISTFNS
jgi:hypothetical protein